MTLGLLLGHPLRHVSLGLSLNGASDEASSIASDAAHFTYYVDTALTISRVHPLGGPTSGGTRLHVYLTDDRLLVDLGGSVHGVYCRFSWTQPSPSRERQESLSVTMHGNLTTCGGARRCGAGWGAIVCESPAYADYGGALSAAGDADVTVEVSINGQDFSSGGPSFRFYDPTSWRVHHFEPRGGPLDGNTSMSLHSALLQDLGDVRCRFLGDDGIAAETNATVHAGGSLVSCLSPAHWERSVGAARYTSVDLTLNGQEYLRQMTEPYVGIFTYYPLNDRVVGPSLLRLSPNGGPSLGGTLVRVNGTGLVDAGGLLCHFAGEHAVPASRVDRETIVCRSPPTTLSIGAAFEPRVLEVTLNGQLKAQTAGALSFHYYRPEMVRVSRVYPLGGLSEGGTAVTVWGSGFVELDHGSGLSCVFSDTTLVPATLATNGGAGSQVLTCVSPPRPPPERANPLAPFLRKEAGSEFDDRVGFQCAPRPAAAVRITLNGNNSDATSGHGGPAALTHDEHGNVTFTYHDVFTRSAGPGVGAGGDVGLSTPHDTGERTSLTTDPHSWTGDDTLR